MTLLTRYFTVIKPIFNDSFQAYYALLKIMVPALLIVKVLQMLGAIEVIAVVLSPLMPLLGLPDLLGIVWATALLSNIFSSLIIQDLAKGVMNNKDAYLTVCFLELTHSVIEDTLLIMAVGVTY